MLKLITQICISHITHIVYTTHVTYVTHKIKVIFEAYKILFTIFFLYIKITNNYCQKHSKKAYEKYQNLSQEEKNKMQKKTRERYQNFTEEKKKKTSVSS